jgi:hypothetical protein
MICSLLQTGSHLAKRVLKNLGSEVGTKMPDSIGSIRLFERKKGLAESLSVPSSLPKFLKHPLAEFVQAMTRSFHV